MYLKSIEMQGFKSFANKILLEFHDGITGIVGPNGSGKSNVSDAVRWVLGEQSAKQLRGGNMQDVIFSGTETRKPLGFASVAITLDNFDKQLNLDYEEVTVTRRLYRSGESEYLMNGHTCRLKDIHELFYDTGIGKEGYSIIGQGQIDKILNGKPEDRRELFDEAAGIVKFKRRKAGTLKKLEEEQKNLVRVTDILSELTKQIEPLERQSEKAKIYLQKKEELKVLDLNLFSLDSKRNEQQMNETEDKYHAAQEEFQQISKEYDEVGDRYAQVEGELESLDQKIETARNHLSNHTLQKQQLEAQVELIREQINSSTVNTAQLQSRMDAIASEMDRRKSDRQEKEKEKDTLLAKLDQSCRNRQEKEEKYNAILQEIKDHSDKAEQGKNDLIKTLNDRTAIKGKIQRYDTMLEQNNIRKSALSRRLLSLKSKEDNEREELHQVLAQYEEISAKVTENETIKDQIDTTIEHLQCTLTEAAGSLETAKSNYQRAESRLESLKNITERYEGYGNSIKKVMEQKDKNPGIHGVVADLIRTKKNYETAIETALGGSMQNIVTDNESTAKYLIEFLKRGHFGRATFLPLAGLGHGSQAKDQKINETGVIGLASDLVEYDPAYRIVAQRLLGRTWVIDTIDHAIAIGRKYKQTLRMVTLEGELLSPGGSMTGGSFKNNSNLLGRRREIEELEKSVRSLKKEILSLKTKTDDTRTQRNQQRDRYNEQIKLLQKLYLEQNTAEMNLQAAREKADTLSADYQGVKREGKELERQIIEIENSRQEIQKEMTDSLQREKDLESMILIENDAAQKLQAKESEASKDLEDAKLLEAGVQQKCHFLEQTLNTVFFEISRLEEEKKTVSAQISGKAHEADTRNQQIEELTKTIETAAEVLQKDEDRIRQLQEEKEKTNQVFKSFFQKRDELSENKNRMDKECFRLSAQLERLRETIDAQVAYIWEEYQITPDQAEAYCQGRNTSRTSLKQEISEIRNEIKALGDVNVNAIEQYKEVSARHAFLSGQYEDLVKAAETLQGIIQELDEGMRRQFHEKFAIINQEFDKAFCQLFGGGKGALELVEDEDVLDAGIRIIAKPPGKKLQNMMQLSGGEKALTAIALLFAIQNMKPSPFCLLDEIEAALDEANVEKFAKYLHKLTKHTQFIVITHRRGTMTAADRLYGITMQEKGVSTLVSVNLIENQLEK